MTVTDPRGGPDERRRAQRPELDNAWAEREIQRLARARRAAMRQPVPRRIVLPEHQNELNQKARRRCCFCAYDVDNPTQLRASGYGNNLLDMEAHLNSTKHRRNMEMSRGRVQMVEEQGYPAELILPIVPNVLYRCPCCSLNKEGEPINRKMQMMPTSWDQHIQTPQHQRRANDDRLDLYMASHPGGVRLPGDAW